MTKAIAREWKHDNASLLAAAVAFYATFSVAPLLVLSLVVATTMLGPEVARREVVDAVAHLVNERTALAVERLLAPAAGEDGTTVTVVSAVLLLVGASRVFGQLRVALNLVLDVPTVDRLDWRAAIRARLISVVMVVATLGLLVVSVVAAAALTSVRNFAPASAAGELAIWHAVEIVVSTLIAAGVFGTILKVGPDAKLAWRNVAVAACFAAILFGTGRYLLGLYLSRTNVTTLYGAAASLFVVLVATYFAVLVLFLAAELTEVLARRDEEFTGDRARRQAVERHTRRKSDADPLREAE